MIGDNTLYGKLIPRTSADIICKTVETFGWRHQIIKAIEEMGELTQRLAQRLNDDRADHDKIAEELADVRIMTEQLMLMFNNHGGVAKWEERKLHRLSDTIATFEINKDELQ